MTKSLFLDTFCIKIWLTIQMPLFCQCIVYFTSIHIFSLKCVFCLETHSQLCRAFNRLRTTCLPSRYIVELCSLLSPLITVVLCRFVPGTFGYEIGQNVSLLYFPDDLAFDRQDNDTSPNSRVSDQKLVFDLRWQGLKIWLRWERFASTAV